MECDSRKQGEGKRSEKGKRGCVHDQVTAVKPGAYLGGTWIICPPTPALHGLLGVQTVWQSEHPTNGGTHPSVQRTPPHTPEEAFTL